LHIRHTHIAPHVRCKANGGIPQNEAGASVDSRTDGKFGQQNDLFNKGELLGCEFHRYFFTQMR